MYNNVTTLLPITPLPHTPPAEPPTVEKAVNIFENEFPSLHAANPTVSNTPPRKSTAPPEPTAVALGWHALQREEEAKKREEEHHKRSLLLWQQAVDGLCQEDEPDEAPITNDVGNIWVSTGASVASLYTELRAEAAKQASIRNMYFDRAAAAFKRNDGASAKRLGAAGREANERMKQLHQKAAEAIFEARNPQTATDVVDLHGLHVSEALERLPAALERAPVGKVRVLTGTGHHTKGTGRARLRPAVKKWLQDAGYFFEEVIDANEFVGSFIVEVKR